MYLKYQTPQVLAFKSKKKLWHIILNNFMPLQDAKNINEDYS